LPVEQLLPWHRPAPRAIAADLAAIAVGASRAESENMTKLPTSLLAAALALPACVADHAATTSTSQSLEREHGDDRRDACPANTPAALAPAADQDLAFVLDAVGTQNYACVATATGFAWQFVAPEANLYRHDDDRELDDADHVFGHHFAGPTWQYEDGSSVVGKKVAAATVDQTAIPWLLLVAASHGGDPDGRMAPVTAIQRLDTHGGLAPASGCDADHVGAAASPIYTARYFFYVTRTPYGRANVRCGG
jgi:hypothetical protein